MLLIINADDLGGTEEINDAIFGLMRRKVVTSATVIANAPAFRHAAERMPEFPTCSFGVHLNLTVFPPAGPREGLEPILDESGNLSDMLFRVRISSSLQEALYRELETQVQIAFRAGVPVSHFDSHQHVHTIPGVFPVLKRLQRRFGVRKVRSTINLLPRGHRMTLARAAKKFAFSMALRHLYATKCPEGLGDFRDFYAALAEGRLQNHASLELMVHPGTTNPKYEEEIALLTSDWQRRLPAGAKLGSFHDL